MKPDVHWLFGCVSIFHPTSSQVYQWTAFSCERLEKAWDQNTQPLDLKEYSSTTSQRCIHVIPPSSSGRLQEMSCKNGKISSKMYHFLSRIQNLPEMNQEFSYIFYTFFINLPEMEEKSP